MTPLSDALTAAQRSALAALEKAYVAGQIEPEAMALRLESFGISDPVDTAYLLTALDVLREWGVSAPTMSERVAETKDEKSSQSQRDYIRSLAQKKGIELGLDTEDLIALTKAQASEVIDSLVNDTYDGEKWSLPF